MKFGMKIILDYYNEAILNPLHFWWNKNGLQKYSTCTYLLTQCLSC